MKVVPLRLQPGDDLRRALEGWMGKQPEQAGCVISGVVSVIPPRVLSRMVDPRHLDATG
jgi:hypothetical protein